MTLCRKARARDEREVSLVSEADLLAKGLINRGNKVDVGGDNGVAVDGVIC